MASASDPERRLLLRPEEAAGALGLSRSRLYEMLRTGEIPSVKIGKSRRVPVEALKAWIAAQLEAQQKSVPVSGPDVHASASQRNP